MSILCNIYNACLSIPLLLRLWDHIKFLFTFVFEALKQRAGKKISRNHSTGLVPPQLYKCARKLKNQAQIIRGGLFWSYFITSTEQVWNMSTRFIGGRALLGAGRVRHGDNEKIFITNVRWYWNKRAVDLYQKERKYFYTRMIIVFMIDHRYRVPQLVCR